MVYTDPDLEFGCVAIAAYQKRLLQKWTFFCGQTMSRLLTVKILL